MSYPVDNNYNNKNVPDSVVYANFWARFGAFVIDGLVLLIPNVLLKYLLIEFPEISIASRVLIAWLYNAIMISGPKQATYGKSYSDIIVTDLNGKRISFLRATCRYFAKIISILIVLIGYIMAGFTKKKQALHDIIAGTIVIYK